MTDGHLDGYNRHVLPPVLEIYVIWHPGDAARAGPVATQIMEHFHGRLFTGLIGGAIEVFLRSESWDGVGSVPRPIGAHTTPSLQSADLTVLMPLLGRNMNHAARTDSGWEAYLRSMREMRDRDSDHTVLLPVAIEAGVASGTAVASLVVGDRQILSVADRESAGHLCRDVAQAITRHSMGTRDELMVFISHTRRDGSLERSVAKVVAEVKGQVDNSRLNSFFDATDLQIDTDWDAKLISAASTSALLAIRSDQYTSRSWCQREMVTAKRSGMPVVILDALTEGEDRGSFTADHVPRVTLQSGPDGIRASVDRALSLLVDESLKRALWQRQKSLAHAANEIAVDWWAPHAPEPLTLLEWVSHRRTNDAYPRTKSSPVRILHPDPPLGPDERQILNQMIVEMGFDHGVEVMTPAALSARMTDTSGELVAQDALMGHRLGCSVSQSDDLAALGLDEGHLRLALGEIARIVLFGGGSILYGGDLRETGYTQFLVKEVQRYGRKEEPLLITLSAAIHERMPIEELQRFEDDLGLLGRVLYIDSDGNETTAGSQSSDDLSSPRALTAMRRFQTRLCAGRVLIGGKRTGWSGSMPGLIEEALLSVEHGSALYLAGGFGGVTLDLAAAVGLVDASIFPHSLTNVITDSGGAAAVEQILSTFRDHGLRNGLTDAENRRLAVTHRPGEVAALVASGLGRLGQARPS